jgi:hypothetical protein
MYRADLENSPLCRQINHRPLDQAIDMQTKLILGDLTAIVCTIKYHFTKYLNFTQEAIPRLFKSQLL